ncbi:hypothetical protein ACJMK2_014015 [Sinanodonta woodiana]|uniref:Innexin n=1 Tax=Sinanodonta woodiana TaxID=1069815 RepID=A0ABD3UZ95_SINWO
MSVAAIIGGWATWGKLRGNDDDDWCDRLNHVYTVVLVVIFALFTGGGQYVGEPIQCWCPAHFTGTYVAYTKSYCWIKNTYYTPMHETIPLDEKERERREITYYQWVPIILLFMAFLFKVPNMFWRMLSGYSGVNLNKIVDMTGTTQIGDPDKRDTTVKHIAMYLDRWLEHNREYHWNILVRMRQKASKFCFLCNKREGTFLTGLYLLTKVLYVANIVSQFFILNAFMGGFYSMWGFEAIDSLAREYEMKESLRFPRVTLCDFKIRQLQNIQPWTVQCVLPINLFNEKIFLFLWFWYILVAVCTCGNFIFWIWRTFFRMNRSRYIRKYLKIGEKMHGDSDRKLCQKFADTHLRDDGIFVLRLVGKNSSDILLTDLVGHMWEIYREKPMIRKALSNESDNRDTFA